MDWSARIDHLRVDRNVVALQALIEARPGEAPTQRARVLAHAVTALASLGDDARLAFDDLLASPHRDVRLAAMNAFALAYPDPEQVVLRDLQRDPDALIRAKASALLGAIR